jgi:hypothetical protein
MKAFMTNGELDPISVYVRRLAPPPERLPKRVAKPDLGVGVLSASVPIDELGLKVVHVPEDDAYSHAHILNPGDKPGQRLRLKRMAEATTVVVEPTAPVAG